MNKKLIAAITIIFLLNLPLLSMPFLENNWDSEAHLFFADHYRNNWFDPWEEKWYGGFWVYSYPPLAHQLVAIFSIPVGLEMGYKLVQVLALLAFPVSVWAISKEIVGVQYTGLAALLGTGVSGIYVVLYTFGQLPAFLALVLVLIAGTFLARYLKSGRLVSLFGWALFAGATAATHHQTSLIMLPILACVLVIQHWITKTFSLSRFLLRVLAAAAILLLVLVVVIAPFWWWFFTQNLPQAEIFHPTRDNIFRSSRESSMFFWDMYGGLLILLPFGLWSVVRRRDLWPLGIAIVFMGILGLGGLTFLPKVIFQQWWKVFTYERFPLWTAVLSLIPISIWLRNLERQGTRTYLIAFVSLLLAIGVMKAIAFPLNRDDLLPKTLPRWQETEIVKFLNQHSEWNYITLGLGEPQLARLSRLTSARTIDGFFHQARWREEQRLSGIGTIDSAPWVGEPSYSLLFPILQRPWDWNLRWAIVNSSWAEIHLRNSGWSLLHPIGSSASFKSGDPVYSLVTVWEAPKVFIPEVSPGQQVGQPGYTQGSQIENFLPYLWGILPLTFLSLGIAVVCWEAKVIQKEVVASSKVQN